MSEAKAKKKKLSIPVKLAIALVLGVVAGLIFKEKASYVAFIGTLFIRLLKMCVYPLVLFSIIAGIANVADIVKLKKIGGQFLLYTFLSSAIAGVLGCLAVTISGAGKGLVLQETVDESVQQVNMVESVVEWVPDNVFAALSNGTLVQIIVFAIFFGIMITQMRKNSNAVDLVAMVVEGCNIIMQRMVEVIMTVAPYGVFCLISNILGGWIDARFGMKALLVTFVLQAAALLGLFAVDGTMPLALVFVFSLALLMYLFSVSCITHFMDVARSRHPKSMVLASSVEPMAFNVGISFGTAVGGAVVSSIGIAYVGAVGAAFSLVAWALTLVTIKLARWERRRQSAQPRMQA